MTELERKLYPAGEKKSADSGNGKKQEAAGMLSKRLQMLADMVTPGNRLADVGCDHGFLSIYLVQAGICPGAIGMDVREGPLAAAKRHVEEFGLGDYIGVRLSDGLTEYGAGEADTLVCAGMGGRLMERILTEGMEKAKQMRELILQPQSELPRFRAFLREVGFTVIQEDAVCEEGKYYFAMKAVCLEENPDALQKKAGAPAGNSDVLMGDTAEQLRLYDMFGELLLQGRHPVLHQYLEHRKRYITQLLTSLAASDSGKARKRSEEVRGELAQIEQALETYFPGQ